MRKLLYAAIGILTLFSIESKAQKLKFDNNKEFKIAQFTDTHLDPGSDYRLGQAKKTFDRMSRVISAQHPDFLVFTGDIVTGRPAGEMWTRLIDSLNVFKIPFCIVLGNHDAEQDLSRKEIAEIVTSSRYSVNKINKAGELADMKITVQGSKSDNPAFAMYCMDSHDYSKVKGIEGYGWFSPEQVSWVRDNQLKHIPALAFFHIVLQEYLPAWRDKSNTHIGRAAEAECPGALNPGMFAAMVENGSIMGIFVGHDHDIDYIVAKHGIAMGYGRFSGDDTTYNNLRSGVRFISVKEGKREFETWIMEDDGRNVDHVFFKDGKISKENQRF